jgi:hypothetical protein
MDRFDLSDLSNLGPIDRAILADAVEDGLVNELSSTQDVMALLRSHQPIYGVSHHTQTPQGDEHQTIIRQGWNADFQVQAVHQQLHRLGVLCSSDMPNGFWAIAEEHLPRGWVFVYDDSASIVGEAAELTASLAGLDVTGDYEEAWDWVWGALGLAGFEDPDQISWRDLDVGLWDDVSGEAGAVYRMAANGGWMYTSTTDPENTDFVSEAYTYNAWYDTAQGALADLAAIDMASIDVGRGELPVIPPGW